MTPVDALISRLPGRLRRWGVEIWAAATLYSLDPYLITAVMDQESLGGNALTPPGPEGVGDFCKDPGHTHPVQHGHGHGLMQIDDRHHGSFIRLVLPGGKHAWKVPVFNVLYGASLLAANLGRFGDYLPAIAAYNADANRSVGPRWEAVKHLSPGERLAALDGVTTGESYVSSVLRRRASYLGKPFFPTDLPRWPQE